jgi:uncharacterized membrane protein
MTHATPTSRVLGTLALLGALVAFALGSAPFTPALMLAPAALPLAIIAGLLGSRRLASISLYWAIAALLANPLAATWRLRVDGLLLAFTILGLLLSAVVYIRHVHVERRS